MKKWGSLVLFSCIIFSCTIRDKKRVETPIPLKDAYSPSIELIKESESIVKDGDLILRSGQEFSSQFIRQFNRHDKTWSHAGIVFFENGHPYIFHIVPGDENPDEKLRKDSLKRFCNPRKNFGFAIYRYNLNKNELSKFKEVINKWFTQGVRFDSSFNLKTDDRMYCSEMIKKGLAIATDKRVIIPTTRPTKNEAQFFASHLHLPFEYMRKLDVIAIDNLFINLHCGLIKRFDYTKQP